MNFKKQNKKAQGLSLNTVASAVIVLVVIIVIIIICIFNMINNRIIFKERFK